MTPYKVRVTCADYNKALPWDRAWEGTPFSDWPRWLHVHLNNGNITPHDTGGTDYAQWHIHTLDGIKNAMPGDYIVYDGHSLRIEETP